MLRRKNEKGRHKGNKSMTIFDMALFARQKKRFYSKNIRLNSNFLDSFLAII